jgi:hypothetical protein
MWALLKSASSPADALFMFSLRADPLSLAEAGVHGLCLSLNRPVLNIADLPVGPARAAALLFGHERGGLSLGLGIWSIETRQSAVFIDRDLVVPGDAAASLEQATRFGERMGFLFDEDVVEPEEPLTRAWALELWNDLLGAPGEPHNASEDACAAAHPPGEQAALGMEDLVLDEVVVDGDAPPTTNPEAEIWLDQLSEAAPNAGGEGASVNPVPLAKFRRCPAGSPPRDSFLDVADPMPPGALGRIALVRRDKRSQRPGPLLRLLGAF